MKAHGRGETENPPKIGVHPQPDAFIHAMPGLMGSGITGVKCVSGYPDNPSRGLPHVLGLLLLLDAETGVPLALMECGWVTAARTAAATALFVRECASSGAEVVGILGAGVQARAIVPAVCHTCPELRRVIVYDPSARAIDQFMAEVRDGCPAEIVTADSVRGAVEPADIIIGATGPVIGPLTRNEWFRPGALLVSVGYGLGEEVMHFADRVLTTDTKQMAAFAGVPLPPIHAELGEVLLGLKPARLSEEERVFARNSGLTICDLAVGQAVFETARAAGIGRWLPLF